MDLGLRSTDFLYRDEHALKDLPTKIGKLYQSEPDYLARIARYHERLAERQDLLYADGRYAVLVVLQGMDTAGKDGAIRHVMAGVNPQGCAVSAFKTPTAEELAHDFLWRSTVRLPRRGMIGIFNRSYYEDVIVTRVHPELLIPAHLPGGDGGKPKKRFWRERFREIRNYEEHLTASGTVIIKIFLHLSKKEQKQRLISRLNDPDKHWKISQSDFSERELFGRYTKVYSDCLLHTSTDTAPWYVIPADDKKNARLILSEILLAHLDNLPLAYPKPTEEQREFIAKMKKEMSSI